ncbi:malto-oligosyltrehalose synthase [Mycobacterium sp. CBMA 234]|uniref:malto-oligosyltrehalose synthase n=1 Tax=Mycolicibacterium sp. CBMA 234 TaxID=1918495 RepID=UPI0012DECBF4|nr:malto-oligosyltrehalose synthase [Mycolicibacterium sp. CBMA 234]MUL63618.1 malto-oligosyltrehalose synthase [Mycolicibacterium sp. CBMA 234]
MSSVKPALPVLSTYRLQMRSDGMTFDDALELLPYLDDLGVSHLYLSPVLTAVTGSTHGYDVTDPTTVSVGLGGPEGFSRLAAAARARGMGLIVDIVPNHVGVERPEQNPWWWDVLTHGRESTFSSYFDIDWDHDPDGRIVLPVLGSESDVDALVVDGEVLRLGERVWPIRPGTGAGTATEVHARQPYRLMGWRSDACGYRRFFSITSLAAKRQEDPAVFDASHAEIGRWFREGLVDGLRVDHIDGLTDPAGYLARLRELTGLDPWIVAEKILAPGEPLEPNLPINGTTGYDALREIGGLFVDPDGAGALTALAAETRCDAHELKIGAAAETLANELARLHRSIERATGIGDPTLPRAIAALLSHVDVYRTDYRSLSAVLPQAISETIAAAPELAASVGLIVAAVNHPEPAARLQQLCGAVTAKAIEDTMFYRDARLVSLNEVGGAPARFGMSAAEFHHRAAVRQRDWPTTMVCLSTHDTKRSEDVRARITALSQCADQWAQRVRRWNVVCVPPDEGTALFVWQNIIGVWPTSGEVSDQLRDRLQSYAEKAIREAQLHTSWEQPDRDFEDAVRAWIDDLLDGPVATEITTFVGQFDAAARSDALAQKLLALTVPGIPDVYQGTELFDDSLVDPDNRRPVDFVIRRAELAALNHPKIRVVAAALRSRRDRTDTYLSGGYTPAFAAGTAADHVIAFQRGTDVLVAVPRWTLKLDETGWGDTALALPAGEWTDRLTGTTWSGTVTADALFAELPGVLLEKSGA